MTNEIDYLRLASQVSREIIKTEPHAAYREMGRPALYDLTDAFHFRARKQCLDLGLNSDELQYLLTNGFEATQEIITNTIEKSNEVIRKKRALSIASAIGTMETVATIAVQSPDVARHYARTASGTRSPFIVTRDDEIRFVHPNYQSIHPTRGCIGAINRETGNIRPVFSNFVRWSGTLAIHSMYKRRRVN